MRYLNCFFSDYHGGANSTPLYDLEVYDRLIGCTGRTYWTAPSDSRSYPTHVGSFAMAAIMHGYDTVSYVKYVGIGWEGNHCHSTDWNQTIAAMRLVVGSRLLTISYNLKKKY